MRIWLDGGLRDLESARVSVLDHGLTVGDGVFETVKAVDGTPFALTRHLDRLTPLGPRPRPARPRPRRGAPRLHGRAGGQPGAAGPAARITYTGGHGPLGVGRGEHGPTLVVAVGETARRPDSTAAITVPWDPQRARGPRRE